MLQKFFKCFNEQLQTRLKQVKKKIETLSKDTRDVMKNQIEILEQKKTITKLKISLGGLISKMDQDKGKNQ